MPTTRYDDLRAVVFNGTGNNRPEISNTDGLLAVPCGIFRRLGVQLTEIRTADHEIPAGLWPDMREHGFDRDEFPAIYRELVEPANILIIAGPISLGDQSSYTRKIIERLYAYSSEVNEAGQWAYYGKVGAALTTGNDDGGEHLSAQILYALPAHRAYDPAAGRHVLDGRGRARAVIPGQAGRRAQRLDDSPDSPCS